MHQSNGARQKEAAVDRRVDAGRHPQYEVAILCAPLGFHLRFIRCTQRMQKLHQPRRQQMPTAAQHMQIPLREVARIDGIAIQVMQQFPA